MYFEEKKPVIAKNALAASFLALRGEGEQARRFKTKMLRLWVI